MEMWKEFLILVIYVVVNSYMMQNFEYTSIQSTIFNTIMSILIMVSIKRVKYYELTKANNPKKFLYFIPLIIISLFNLKNGIHINNSSSEII